jgi:hypothetical protein
MIPPWAWAAASASRALVFILCDGSFGIGAAGEPPGVHLPPMVCDGFGFPRLGRCIGLSLLLRQLTRMHHDKAQLLLRNAPFTILHIHQAEHALSMPTAGLLVLRPPGLFYQEGQSRLLAPPRFKLLPNGTGARDQGH